ncbi:SRPBCC domain-containing protein [Pollutibacter soli]|uniref:SRPBCC family protein n=1 Tax=Pollutibacter soli TaxID=3034157 RepID=UPI0030137790
MKAAETTRNHVTIERVFDAPVELLWRIWTEPEFIMQWFGGDPNGTVISAEMNLSVGKVYKIKFADSNGSEHTAFGEFTLVEKAKRLHYSWEWLSEPGKISNVEVEFLDMGDQSKLVLVHKNLHPDSSHEYQVGWTNAINKIDPIAKRRVKR